MADLEVGEVDPAPTMDFGKAVADQISNSIKNADVMGMLQKMVASSPEDEESEEIRQKLQGVMSQYEAMTSDDKVKFVAELKDVLAAKLSMKFQENPLDMSAIEDAVKGAIVSKLYLMGAAALLIFIILVFFGYKLYKSIKDKEKKREEKKKLKQMKKKK